MPTTYYQLVRRTLPDTPSRKLRIVSAAVWSCALCKQTIDGMGGPGDGEICIACGDDIKAGRLGYSRPTYPKDAGA